ncbi:MAG: autotransporter outer membrane beta-barrel domain-containing protein [Phascolarctobacterium sp.]|nr:autotransporter outer membrane beta-barrel domain-containing protein [Phascolarctobacterium sp.]
MRLSFGKKRSWKKHLAVAITAGLLSAAYAPGAWADSGDYDNQGTKPDSKVVDQNINIAVHSSDYSAQGINVGYGSPSAGKKGTNRFVSVFNGNITMKDAGYSGGWGITADNIHGGYSVYRGARWQPAGIRAGLCADVTVNGDLDMAVYGSGLVTDPYYTLKDGTPEVDNSTINVNGNVKIVTPELSNEAFYAIANYGGTINVNAAGNKNVVLLGNVLTMQNDGSRAPFFVSGITNITLNNAASSWTGVVDNTGKAQTGQVNLTLANGAQWEHRSLSMTNGMHVATMPSPSNDNYGTYDGVTYLNRLTGGANAAQTGYIRTSSSAPINIANYSGYTTVYYAHNNAGTANSDYTAGDVIIGSAAANSGIALVTASNGVNTNDVDQVNKVLNVLAGKLTYTGYSAAPDNLAGTVKIAGGLTSDAAVLKEGNIVFNDSGKGTYMARKTSFTTVLTGDKAVDKEYADSGIVKADGTYKFEDDSSIKVTANGASAIGLTKPTNVEATTLTLNATQAADGTAPVTTIKISAPGTYKIDADKLVMSATASGNSNVAGLSINNTDKNNKVVAVINGDQEITTSNGRNYNLGVYVTGNSDVTMNGSVKVNTTTKAENYYESSGIYAGGFLNYSDASQNSGSHVTVNGAVDVKGDGCGVVASYVGSVLDLNGNVTVEATKAGMLSVGAQSGTVNINMNEAKNAASNNTVKLLGNIGLMNGAVSDAEPCKDTTVNLGLSNSNSYLTGVVYDAFKAENKADGFTGTANIYLTNGAVWNNELVAELPKDAWGFGFYGDYTGSKVAKLSGGSSVENAGNIFQKDSNPLTIDNYSGVTNIFYAHANDGTLASDYTAYGDTIINHAAANSQVNLITNAPSSITVDSLNGVLNALAGKLTYSDYTDGKRDLTGVAKIAGGLTTDSVELAYGNIVFSDADGKGTGVDSVNLAATPENQVTSSFFTTMTGNTDKDLEYLIGGVMKGTGKFVFTEDSKIEVNGNGASAINLEGPTTIAAKALSVNAMQDESGTGKVMTVKMSVPGSYQIDADKLTVKATAVGRRYVYGFNIDNADKENKLVVAINGNTEVNTSNGANYNIGVYARGNSDVTLNGDLKVNINTEATNYYESSAIYAGGTLNSKNPEQNVGSHITINGNVDIKSDGNGVLASYVGSVADLNGDVSIEATRAGMLSVAAQSGTVNINMNESKDGASNNTVKLTGNVGLINGAVNPKESCKDTIINLGLNNSDSYLTGVIFDAFKDANKEAGFTGTANIYLSNGAVWNNELVATVPTDKWGSYGEYTGSKVAKFTGGTASSAGNIYQKDGKPLTIDNYSGVTNIFYAHANEGTEAGDYTAGDTIIKHAEEGSVVNLITNGTAQTEEASLGKILSALAGKLTYANHATEQNLTGTVKLAAGLTSDSVVWALSDIVFGEDGKGTIAENSIVVPEPPKEQGTNTTFNSTLNGGLNLEYHHGGVHADNGYKFTENTTINIENGNTAIEGTNDIKINATDKTLTLTVKPADSEDRAFGIKQEKATTINLEADKLAINVAGSNGNEGIRLDNVAAQKAVTNINAATEINLAGSASSKGITVNGNSELNIKGDLSINNSSTSAGEGAGSLAIGIYAGSKDAAPSVGSVINITGATTLQGNGTGVAAIGGGSTINLQGATQITTGSADLPAIVAASGTVNVNMTAASTNTVKLQGNLMVTKKALADDGSGADSVINIKMDNSSSSWTGVAYNAFKEKDAPNNDNSEDEPTVGPEDTPVAPVALFALRAVSEPEPVAAAAEPAAPAVGAINLSLSNGAVWTNELVGELPLGNSTYSGSRINNFEGGSDYSHSGYIVQRDTNPLTITNYSGSGILVYEHANDGTSLADYTAGNTTIENAAAGSLITLSTDNKNIDTNSKETVEKVMTALAQKLLYAAAGSNTNLQGQVQIAGSLTTNKVALWLGDLTFDANNVGKFTEGSAHTTFTIVDEEADSSKGLRGAITSNLNSWRDLASSSFTLRDAQRIRQAAGGRGPVDSGTRLGAEDSGTWARVYGGQSKYSGNNTSYDGNNWAAQVGYDKQLANGWTLGVALDYQDGSVSYVGGSGDTELYGLSILGSKELANNSYLDLAMRVGHVKNEFSASETRGGDYSATGYSLSAQYSKRFGDVDAKGYVEPQLQLTWSRMGSSDFGMTDIFDQKYSVKQDAFNSFVGRLGVEVGQASDYGHYYARLSVAHEFAGDMDTHFADEYGRSKDRSFDLGDTWTEITVGGTYNLGKNMSLFGDVSKSLSGDYKDDWKVNAGLRFTF